MSTMVRWYALRAFYFDGRIDRRDRHARLAAIALSLI